MLVLWDGAFQTLEMSHQCLERGAQFLGRLPRTVKPIVDQRLADGSYLVTLRPHSRRSGANRPPLQIRVIEYELTDPGRPGYGERRRLATSLLDADRYPATALVLTYHERWEIELVIDEVDTHQRQPRQPFRSRTPDGVVQELYGLLIAHYAIRALMHTVAVRLELPADRLSFVHSLRTLRDWSIHLLFVARRQWRQVTQRVLRILGEVVLPPRANRSAPRQVKRKYCV